MRIKSPFKDYYDGVQQYGQDDVVYIRYPQQVKNLWLGATNVSWNYLRSRAYYTYDRITIAFCGKFYPAFKFKGPDLNTEWLYDEETIKAIYKKYDWEYKERRSFYMDSGHAIANTFRNIREKGNATKVNDNLRVPIVVAIKQDRVDAVDADGKTIHNRTVLEEISLANCRLMDYNFQKIFDPYSAFQEIRMFLSNLANLEKPIPKIDNVTMAEAKGFDKWSFRKEPTKKRKVKK